MHVTCRQPVRGWVGDFIWYHYHSLYIAPQYLSLLELQPAIYSYNHAFFYRTFSFASLKHAHKLKWMGSGLASYMMYPHAPLLN